MLYHYKRLVKNVTAVAVIASVVVFLVPTVIALSERLSGRLGDFNWILLALAFGMTLIYWTLNAYMWNQILRALGYRLPAGTSIRIWLGAQTCRWLPGGVWHYGSRTLQAAAFGIPSSVSVASLALELVLTIAGWAVVSLLGIAYFENHRLTAERFFTSRMSGLGVPIGLALLLLGIAAYAYWRWFPQKGQMLRERFASLRLLRPRVGATLICFLGYVALGLFNGISFYLVLVSVPLGNSVPFWAAISANALAWIVGLFVIMAPGGLVVREATLALLLSPWLPPGTAVLIAVLWRVVQLVVELVCVAAVYALQATAVRRARSRDQATPWGGFSHPAQIVSPTTVDIGSEL